jgi:hypothetical protein
MSYTNTTAYVEKPYLTNRGIPYAETFPHRYYPFWRSSKTKNAKEIPGTPDHPLKHPYRSEFSPTVRS